MTRYFGWADHEGMVESWSDQQYDEQTKRYAPLPPDGMATDAEVLFASYGGADYEGDAMVLFERGGTLYEVHGSHCSCYGLEGQWEPEATTWRALAARPFWSGTHYDNPLYDHDKEARQTMLDLLAAHGFPTQVPL